MSELESQTYEGIEIPMPASKDEHPDEGFREKYKDAIELQRAGIKSGFLPEDHEEPTLEKFAIMERWVEIPLTQYIGQWEKEKYGGEARWSQDKWEQVYNTVRRKLLQRAKDAGVIDY